MYDNKEIGSDALDIKLRKPYVFYENLLKNFVNKDTIVLDICCGDGIFSFTSIKRGAHVTCLDFAEESINIAKERAKILNLINKVEFVVADAEKLPLHDKQFDIVTCVGSLSYLNINIFLNEVLRVLKPNGKIVFLDSFNHNIIYKLNRFIQVLRGIRSLSTYRRIPDTNTLNTLNRYFTNTNVYYFNIFIWLSPILNLFLNKNKTKIILDNLDDKFSIFNKYAFKIIITGNKKTNI